MSDALIRQTEAHDFETVLALLRRAGLPTAGVREHFQHFLVAELDGEIVGCVGLELYGAHSLLRSLAVAKEHHKQGLGTRLTQEIIAQASSLGSKEIVLLTTTAENFFRRFGFEKIAREEAPREVHKSVEFQSACPTTATCMKLRLAPEHKFSKASGGLLLC